MSLSFIGLILLFSIKFSVQSAGDRSPYYNKCVEKCGINNCSSDGFGFKNDDFVQPVYEQALQWSCEDECRYECMWKTVAAFHHRGWRTPQFFGKWPFVRFFGVQEPASALFSFLNFYAHLSMIKKFRRQVDPESPYFWLWHLFCAINLNGWLYSIVFHTRDFPWTEFLDYVGAFAIMLSSCYCMVVRLLGDLVPRFMLVTISVFFLAFFVNHATYLSMGRFDYSYNMQLNLLFGTFTAICWFGWSTYNRIRQPYVWKCAIFVSLTGLVMLLEIVDAPPFLWIFDCHSLWHLSTVPLICLFYSFAIDDCNYLRKQSTLSEPLIVEPRKKQF